VQALAEAEQGGSRFAVMFMDLDGFKQVNDAYGHQAGDALLVAVAERTRQLLRPHDMLARLGGDEFVLVVRIEHDEDLPTLARRILQAVGSGPLLPDNELQVTASIGVAICPDHAASERQLMAFADAAMYQAKESGRNAFVLFADWMNDSAEQQFRLLADLRRAIGSEQLFLHYQPKIRVATQKVAGAEALIRWRHPEHGLIPPDRFIRLAERSGAINEIGRWALDQACQQLRRWHDAGHEGWSMSVNLSPVQFSSPHLLQDVRAVIERHGIAPRHLVLEITESTVMRDTDTSLRLLQALSALGVGISIDDFGTGYSSLLYLKRLPATEIKIDHAFVRDLEHSAEDVVIVSAIVALGHALDMDIVAEAWKPPPSAPTWSAWAATSCRATCSAARSMRRASCSCTTCRGRGGTGAEPAAQRQRAPAPSLRRLPPGTARRYHWLAFGRSATRGCAVPPSSKEASVALRTTLAGLLLALAVGHAAAADLPWSLPADASPAQVDAALRPWARAC
jgi:diguanylate cyclase (GGDEF)-like protein